MVQQGEVAYHNERGEKHAHEEAPLARRVRHGRRRGGAAHCGPRGRAKHQPGNADVWCVKNGINCNDHIILGK